MVRSVRVGLVSIAIVLAGCGSAPPSAAPTTPTPVPVSSAEESALQAEDEAAPLPIAPPEGVSADARVQATSTLISQIVHRTDGARYDDPAHRFVLFVSRRAIALHDPATGDARAVHFHRSSGDVFLASIVPTLRSDVVLVAIVAGGDPTPSFGESLIAVHAPDGRFVTLDVGGAQLGAGSVPLFLGAQRVLVGSRVIDLASGHARALELALSSRAPEEPDPDVICNAAVSPDHRRFAIVGGRFEYAESEDEEGGTTIWLFDARTLRATGRVPGYGGSAYESCGVSWLTYRPGTDRLVTADPDGVIVEVAPDGTTSPLPLPDGVEEIRFAGRDGAHAITDEDPPRSLDLAHGAADVTATVGAPSPPPAILWMGTQSGDGAVRPPARGRRIGPPVVVQPGEEVEDDGPAPQLGGERSIWNVAFVPGGRGIVTAGRGAVYRWSEAGAAPIPCLTGQRALAIAEDGVALEPGGGRCNVVTGEGHAGPLDEADSGMYYDCWDLQENDEGTGFDVVVCDDEAMQEPHALTGAEQLTADQISLDRANDLVVGHGPDGLHVWSHTGTALGVLRGGGTVLAHPDASTVFVRASDGHLRALSARRLAAARRDLGALPPISCDATPVGAASGAWIVHVAGEIRVLDPATLAVRTTIPAEGACHMQVAGEHVWVEIGGARVAFALDGARVAERPESLDFSLSADGSALVRCAAGAFETRSLETGAPTARWEGACESAVVSEGAQFLAIRTEESSRVRFVRVADGAWIEVGSVEDGGDDDRGAHASYPFALGSSGSFWTPDTTPHDVFSIREGPRVLEDPLVTGEACWARYRSATLLADFFEGRPLAAPAPS